MHLEQHSGELPRPKTSSRVRSTPRIIFEKTTAKEREKSEAPVSASLRLMRPHEDSEARGLYVFTTLGQSAAVAMPVCHYEVFKGTRGEEVRVGLVGEEVYHKWNCETYAVNTFCMVVHDCKVHDGSGDVIQLLDEDGCSLDKFILDDLDYQADLMAGREAHVFKYADRANLYLDCQIRISIKEPETGCLRPTCNGNRVRRDWKKTEGVGLDVAAAPMVIASLGLTEADLPYSVRRAGNHTIDFYGPEKHCLSPLGLTLALCILIMILTVTVTVFVKLFDNRKMLD